MCHGKVWLNSVRLSQYQKLFSFVNHSFRSEDIFRLLSLDVVEENNRNRQFWAHVLEGGESPENYGQPFSNLAHFRTRDAKVG